MSALFAVHKLNDEGLDRARDIAFAFEVLVANLEGLCPPGRERAIVMTKLEEACFFAKKAMAMDPKNRVVGELL